MIAEIYLPHAVQLAGASWPGVAALAIHDPDSGEAHGLITTALGKPPGTRGGLTCIGRRDGARWRVNIDEIEIVRTTAAGCEFIAHGSVRRARLDAEGADP